MPKASKKRKKAKKVVLKLSFLQAQSLNNYCELHHTSPNKLIKKLLKHYTEEFSNEKIGKQELIKNQLTLFEQEEENGQLGVFDIPINKGAEK
ncbi:MAG: hypothetical protein B7C24_06360 [Bacteroidetes bacterium 4572_77]|nr:MAG: hypothetical protein B7C24_06360 [Bacteroidetes bacterium 4572_77]